MDRCCGRGRRGRRRHGQCHGAGADTGELEGGGWRARRRPGRRRGSLVSNDHYKDFELELEFMLAEHGSGCTAELIGPEQANASKDRSCLYNSGISFRTGYQVNIGRRESGEHVGIVVHRKAPGAIRGNVLWLDRGDDKFPNLRKRKTGTSCASARKGHSSPSS